MHTAHVTGPIVNPFEAVCAITGQVLPEGIEVFHVESVGTVHPDHVPDPLPMVATPVPAPARTAAPVMPAPPAGRVETITAAFDANFPHVVAAQRAEEIEWWLESGIPTAAVVAYMEAGTFEAGAAHSLWVAGFGPEVAARPWRNGMTIGYAVANGDLSIAGVEAIMTDAE